LLSWADEIIILNQGKIIQRGKPGELYHFPTKEYVAALFGKYTPVSPELIRLFPSLKNTDRQFIRPGDFKLSTDENRGIKGEVISSLFMGGYFETLVNVGAGTLVVTHNADFILGEAVYVSFDKS
jgi:ABC-type Fe3+/spermidine/putrescine transport system ATPase subunit